MTTENKPVADGGGTKDVAIEAIFNKWDAAFSDPAMNDNPPKLADGGGLPDLGVTLGQETEQEWTNRVLDCRERQLTDALSALQSLKMELSQAREEIAHWEEKPFYTRNIFENDGEMVGKDWDQVTEEDFRGLFEYSDNCKCQGCSEIRYILLLRGRMEQAVDKLEHYTGPTCYNTSLTGAISILKPEGSSKP